MASKTKQNDTTKYLSSDEIQPMNASIDASPAAADDRGLVDGDVRKTLQSRTESEESVTLPEILTANLPPATRENLERALTSTRRAMIETQNYVRDNPGEAAGLLACSGAIVWALFGTKPGRRIVEFGAPLLNRYVADGINNTFGLKGPTLQ